MALMVSAAIAMNEYACVNGGILGCLPGRAASADCNASDVWDVSVTEGKKVVSLSLFKPDKRSP